MFEIKVEGCLELSSQGEKYYITPPTIEILYGGDIVATSSNTESYEARVTMARLIRQARQKCMLECDELNLGTLTGIIEETLSVELQDSGCNAGEWYCTFRPIRRNTTSGAKGNINGSIFLKFLNQAICDISDGKIADNSLFNSGITKYSNWLDYFNFVAEGYFPCAGSIRDFDKEKLPDYKLLKGGMIYFHKKPSRTYRVVVSGESELFPSKDELCKFLEDAGVFVQSKIYENTDYHIWNFYKWEERKPSGLEVISEENFLKKVLGVNTDLLRNNRMW